MITINLLPVKQIQKRLKALADIIKLGVFLAATLIALGVIALLLSGQISGLKKEIAALQADRDTYKDTLEDIEKLKKDKADLETKLNVISTLKKDSRLTVRLVDEIANLVPQNKMWLLSLSQGGGKLIFSGVAQDNAIIANFMNDLEASPYFANPELQSSSMYTVEGQKLKNFALTCDIVQPADPPVEDEKKG